MSPNPLRGVLKEVRAAREILERIEARLSSEEGVGPDPYQRRVEILRRIFWAGNGIARAELMPLLASFGTDYRWIGQQVKKGYLSVLPLPDGSTRYSVTPKAIRELALDKDDEEAEGIGLSTLSEAAFAEDWESAEDSIYDSL